MAELSIKIKDDKKLEKIIKEIEKNSEKFKAFKSADSFRAQNYMGIELMKKRKYRDASKMYK